MDQNCDPKKPPAINFHTSNLVFTECSMRVGAFDVKPFVFKMRFMRLYHLMSLDRLDYISTTAIEH